MAVALGVSGAASASEPIQFTGSIVGLISNAAGVPQMGATILLYDHNEKLVQRALSNEKGAFGFDSLVPDSYSIRVTLSSFLPALKRIAVQPGMRSFLEVNLAGVLSSVELVYTVPAKGSLMTDDWKWVLRNSLATRPILRILPGIDISDPRSREVHESNPFSNTRGLVRVSAGDVGASEALGNQPDLGTAFALATSLFGAGELQFSGNVAYASSSGMPSTGFRTSFTRGNPGSVVSPEVQLTMRQVFLPLRAGASFLPGSSASAPALRTMSVAVHDSTPLTDDLRFEYGFSLDSVTFLERLNYLSPYARLTYEAGDLGTFRAAYSSGAPPAELLAASDGEDLHQNVTALSFFPRVSLRDGNARVQRSENFEIGYRKVLGSRIIQAAVFQEAVSNAALTMSGAGEFGFGYDLLPDLGSPSLIFNAGNYRSMGYMGSLTQNVGEEFSATVAYGSGGVLRTDQREMQTGTPDELRAMVRHSQQHWASARVAGIVPFTGTRYATSYMWTDYRSLTPNHTYLTHRFGPTTGLNLQLRQPIPAFGGFPGRLEATAELRNMLAQGYLPIQTTGGRCLLLTQSPRAVRGGLSFIF